MNKKEESFKIWCEVIKMIDKKEHLTQEGFNLILQMRESMRQINLDL
jgi:hypothetical protein